MTLSPVDLALAWGLDAAIGDPGWIPWPHPVVAIGRGAGRLEGLLRSRDPDPWIAIVAGGLFWVVVVGASAAAGAVALTVAGWLHPLLERALGIYLASACLATRGLDQEARAVARLLRRGRLDQARRQLARIVGRDTESLPAREVARGAVETVAENASDGVVAPLLYLGVGGALGWGPLLGLAYKAVNTLDSMVGYRTPRHEYFGKVSARLDDAANWVPARLTAVLTAVVAQALWRRGRPAWAMAQRDGRLHKSPNSGYPEAAFAGALGVSLGGTSTYGGVARHSPRLGDPGPALESGHVERSLVLLWAVSLAGLALAAGLTLL